MDVIIILNGISRKKNKFYKEILPVLANHFNILVRETQRAGDAETLAITAVSERPDVILAAGGDGTLSQVVNGMLRSQSQELPRLGVIPLGTGNDFARTCSIHLDAEQIKNLLLVDRPRPIDIGTIVCEDENGSPVTRHFINVCSIGMGPEVVKRLLNNSRRWGPEITYLVSIVAAFFALKPQAVRCKTADWEWEGSGRVIAFANGASFGHAMYIAPDAMIDDGILNTFIAGDLPVWRFLLYLQGIKAKKKINDPKIKYNTARQAEISSIDPCLLEAEGEMVGYLPAIITLMAGKINFIR